LAQWESVAPFHARQELFRMSAQWNARNAHADSFATPRRAQLAAQQLAQQERSPQSATFILSSVQPTANPVQQVRTVPFRAMFQARVVQERTRQRVVA